MNREEILAKSRKENVDEGLRDAQNRGRRIGTAAFAGMVIVVLIFNLIQGRNSYDVFAIFWAYIAAQYYPLYQFTKKSGYLMSAILGATASLAFLAAYIISVVM